VSNEYASRIFLLLLGAEMNALDKRCIRVERYVRKLRGGSQPILVEGSDGLLYIVKFTNNLQGKNLPFNESMGTEVFKACTLPVPTWKPVFVTPEFVDQTPQCWMEAQGGKIRPEPGISFGSRFLGGPNIRLFEILPGTAFNRIQNRNCFWLAWVMDICCQHTDNRQSLFVAGPRGYRSWFIDMGHLFGGAKGDQKPRHFVQSRYLDPRIYGRIGKEEISQLLRSIQSLNAEKLWRTARALPEDWVSASALRAFFRALDTLANVELVQNILLQITVEARARREERLPTHRAGAFERVGLFNHATRLHETSAVVG